MSNIIKDGDLYSYAVVHVGTHGFTVDPHEDYSSPIEFIPASDPRLKDQIKLLHTNGVVVNVEDIDVLIKDARQKEPGNMIMVYRAGKTADQVLEIIHLQLRDKLQQYQMIYQKLLDNAREMTDAIDEKMVAKFFCKPVQEEP